MAKKKKNPKKIKRKIKEIKSKKKIIKKDSELEGDIKEAENLIENTEFQEFLQSTQPSAPVLKKVESPNLEINIASSPMMQTEQKETGVDYVSKNAPQNEPKYTEAIATDNPDEKKYESDFKSPVLSQTDSRGLRQQVLTSPNEITRDIDTSSNRIETNIIEQKTKEPFETQEEKYRKVKF